MRRPPQGGKGGAQMRLGRGMFAAIGVADGEHRPCPAGLSGVVDGLGEAPGPAERCFRRSVAALDRGDPAALRFDLGDRRAVADDELPVMFCPNGQVLRRPTDAEAGACLGITPELDAEKLYDVAVVGAGVFGAAAAAGASSASPRSTAGPTT